MFSFCKPISSKKRFLPNRALNKQFSFTLFDKAKQIPAQEWDKFADKKGLFLKRDYLKIIEQSLFAKMQSRYVVVYCKGEPCGIIYYQVIDFNASVFSNLIPENSLSKHKTILKKYVDYNQDEILMRLFTCGNNLISGDFGFCFDSKMKDAETHSLLLEITEIIANEDKLKNTISAIILKDFENPLKPARLFKEENYSHCSVEANMIVKIPNGIETLEDYIQLFSKKYRNRAKSVFKKFSGVSIKNLNAEEVKNLDANIYNLYEAIFNEAQFKLLKLPLDYFSATKTFFDKEFFIKGLFLNNQLVGFYSYFIFSKEVVEAHYIGLNYEFNQDYCLYQNILYDLISIAIENKASVLNLGRTAAEIKTTVGALPQDLICYIKPQNTFSKFIQKPLVNLLQPADYIARNPFKEELTIPNQI